MCLQSPGVEIDHHSCILERLDLQFYQSTRNAVHLSFMPLTDFSFMRDDLSEILSITGTLCLAYAVTILVYRL